MDVVESLRCASCRRRRKPRYLELRLSEAAEPRIEVVVLCNRCCSSGKLLHSLPLALNRDVQGQMYTLARILEVETGLNVLVFPPDDPPAGDREPRRPLPSAGSAGVALAEPA